MSSASRKRDHQPTKAELEEPIVLPGNPTPEQLAKALMNPTGDQDR